MLKKIPFIIIVLFFLEVSSQERVTIFWDSSLSMIDRDLEKEFKYIDAYFNKHKNIACTLLIFSHVIKSKDEFNIVSGDWKNLKVKLTKLKYDGATSYQFLDDYTEVGDVLLFSDGFQNMDSSVPKFKGNLYIINSKKNFNNKKIQFINTVNSGKFMNLLSDDVKNKVYKTLVYKGKVYGIENEGIEEVKVHIKGKEHSEVFTDASGAFKINAQINDILIFSLKDKNYLEEQLGENKNIDLFIDNSGEKLDEVVIKSKLKKSESKEIITALGKKDRDEVGYSVETITEEELVPSSSNNLTQAVQGKFSGDSYGVATDISYAKPRGFQSFLLASNVLIVLDGIPLKKSGLGENTYSQNTSFIDPNNVASVTIIKSLAATAVYGQLGNNGAILITTKTATFDKRKNRKDLALITNNVYKEKIKTNKSLFETDYIKKLKKEKNVETAYRIYLNQRKQYWETHEYFVDVFDFFKESNKDLAVQILTNIIEKDNSLLSQLKIMSYKAQQIKNYSLGLVIANRILELYPNQVQSYLDLALAYRNNAEYQKALDLLIAIDNDLMKRTLDFSSIEKSVKNEILDLVRSKRNKLDLSKLNVRYKNLNLKYNARLIFEWNNNDAEFELQFINPQKKFFKWKHTNADNLVRIRDELKNGYSKKEFEIVGQESKGKWRVNVNYFGNRTIDNKSHTFLKCIIQYNYGKPNQRTEEHLIRLHKKVEEELFLKLDID